MKSYILLILFLLFSLLIAQQTEYLIINTANEEVLDLSELIEELQSSQVVFFGEYHDNALLHQLEIDLLKGMYAADQDLAVSLEMFERDIQPVLDKYLNGEIAESDFLEGSRPWPNYSTDYRPLIEFSREQGLAVIAANVPRRYAAMIHKIGLHALDSLDADEKRFIATNHIVLDDEYKTRFIETMQENMSHSPNSPMAMKMNFDLIYAAQCIKDDTMAESIQKYLAIKPGDRVIHFNGDFHSRKHLGTAQKFHLLMPDVKTVVIAPLLVEAGGSYSSSDLEEADFLILIYED